MKSYRDSLDAFVSVLEVLCVEVGLALQNIHQFDFNCSLRTFCFQDFKD